MIMADMASVVTVAASGVAVLSVAVHAGYSLSRLDYLFKNSATKADLAIMENRLKVVIAFSDTETKDGILKEVATRELCSSQHKDIERRLTHLEAYDEE
jgi:hypothetical protein